MCGVQQNFPSWEVISCWWVSGDRSLMVGLFSVFWIALFLFFVCGLGRMDE
jgi:hypothetical protein